MRKLLLATLAIIAFTSFAYAGTRTVAPDGTVIIISTDGPDIQI